MTHCIIFEPDPACRQTLEGALASLYWRSDHADSLPGVAARLPGPWAVLAAIESGDIAALESVREMRALAAGVVICILLDEHSPRFDAQVLEAGADMVFAKPVTKTEIVGAVVDGFLARRR